MWGSDSLFVLFAAVLPQRYGCQQDCKKPCSSLLRCFGHSKRLILKQQLQFMFRETNECGVQPPEYVEVNVTVKCADGSKEDQLQPAPGLTILPCFPLLQKTDAVGRSFDHALHHTSVSRTLHTFVVQDVAHQHQHDNQNVRNLCKSMRDFDGNLRGGLWLCLQSSRSGSPC